MDKGGGPPKIPQTSCQPSMIPGTRPMSDYAERIAEAECRRDSLAREVGLLEEQIERLRADLRYWVAKSEEIRQAAARYGPE